MSNEWNLLKGIKMKTQNNYFNKDETISEKTLQEFYENKKRNENIIYEMQQNELEATISKDADIELNSEIDVSKMDEYQNSIKETLSNPANERFINKNIGNIHFHIDMKNKCKVSFSDTYGNFVMTINGNDKYSEVYIDTQEQCTYVKQDTFKKSVNLKREITVIDGEEINETYYIDGYDKIDDKMINEIMKDFVATHPEYEQLSESEIGRNNIDFNEKTYGIIEQTKASKIQNLHKDGFYDFESGFYKCIPKKINYQTFGDCIIPAKKVEKKCNTIYSMIMKAYKEIENTQNIENNTNKNETQKYTNINMKNKTETLGKNNIEDFNNEELDKFINNMDAEQKEKDLKIERLKKIKKARELIAFGKKQDKEIFELESQIQMEEKI